MKSAINKEALQKGMEEFFHMALDLMCISDYEGNLLKVNVAWEKAIGYTVEEMEGKLFKDFIHPDDVEATFAALERLDKGEDVINFTNRYYTKSGVYKTIEWRARPKGDFIFASASDVTERERMVNGLTMEKVLLEETSKVSGVGGWEVDLINNIVTWSETTKKIHEVTPDYIPNLESGINFYKEGESRDKITKVVAHAMETGEGWDVELQLVTAENKEIWVRAIGKALIKEGNCERLYGTFQDITEKKKYQETLEEALLIARDAAKTKSSFLSNMSHEIRTPLNAVIGMAHLLLQNNPREDQLEKLETLHFSANNLMALVNDILDYSKIEEGKINLEEIPFSLKDTVKNIKHTFKFKAEEKGIKFKVSMDSDVPNFVVGDPTRLVQILNNLISNAIKFTEKGRVKLNLEVTEDTEDTVLILFEIKDTGIGMSSSQLAKVFDRFEQASIGTTRKFGGTGLGLSIVKKLLEFHGSTIKIDSKEGQGSTFSFQLNLKKSSEQESLQKVEDKISNQVKDLEGMRILLVEDNPMNQLVATEFLKNWNVVLDYAINGAEAVEKVTDNEYDIILMDIQMPVMDGYEATRRIKSLSNERSKIPIIAMTASALLEVKNRLHEIGMVDHILKPFNPTELNLKLSNYLSAGGTSEEEQYSIKEEQEKKIRSIKSDIDFEDVYNLFDGNRAFSEKILITFLRDIKTLKNDFNKALEKKNKTDLLFMMHKNKSMVRMLHLKDLEILFDEYEHLIGTDKWQAIDVRLLTKHLNNVQSQIEKNLGYSSDKSRKKGLQELT